jgi:hypothetical protein
LDFVDGVGATANRKSAIANDVADTAIQIYKTQNREQPVKLRKGEHITDEDIIERREQFD